MVGFKGSKVIGLENATSESSKHSSMWQHLNLIRSLSPLVAHALLLSIFCFGHLKDWRLRSPAVGLMAVLGGRNAIDQ